MRSTRSNLLPAVCRRKLPRPYFPAALLTGAPAAITQKAKPTSYRNNPVLYCRRVLGMKLWDKQEEILQSLLEPPYRTMVLSGHNLGKTHIEAAALSWWYDTRDPSLCASTSSTEDHLASVLWYEVRMQRQRVGLGDFRGRAALELQSSVSHRAVGSCSINSEAFQGKHWESMFFIFDECIGVKPFFWDATRGMFKPDGNHAWLACGNPTDTTSRAYTEAHLEVGGKPVWRVLHLDAMEHPNIRAWSEGRPDEIPRAISYGQLSAAIEEDCEVIYREPR